MAIIACAAIALASPACKKKKTERPPGPEAGPTDAIQAITWSIDDVAVELARSEPEDGSYRPPLAGDIDSTGLARRIGKALRATDHFTSGDGEAASGRRLERAQFRARITYGVIAEGSTGGPSLFVTVEGQLSPEDPAYLSLRDNVATERPLPEGEKPEALDTALMVQIHRAVDEMVGGVIAKEALRGARAGALREALSGSPDRVKWALELIGRRRLTQLAGPVRELLTSTDSAVADAAISTSVALGDSDAIKVLTEGIDFQDHERMRVVIEASAALGGNEAQQFLEFVATGHEDADVKAHAADALERLRRRR